MCSSYKKSAHVAIFFAKKKVKNNCKSSRRTVKLATEQIADSHGGNAASLHVVATGMPSNPLHAIG